MTDRPTVGALPAAEIPQTPLRTIWRDRLIVGTLNLICGQPGVGKSSLTALIAAELSRQGKTIILSNCEDDPGAVTVPRLSVAGAILERVHVIPPEWSPCDERCTHAGPARGNLWPGVPEGFEDRWRPIEFTERFPTAGVWRRHMRCVEAQWRILTTHHLTGVKADRWWNLAALCQRCHLEVQGKVVMDRVWPHEHSAWFRPYVAGYYAHRYLGEDITREEAEARVDELLALEVRQLTLEAT